MINLLFHQTPLTSIYLQCERTKDLDAALPWVLFQSQLEITANQFLDPLSCSGNHEHIFGFHIQRKTTFCAVEKL